MNVRIICGIKFFKLDHIVHIQISSRHRATVMSHGSVHETFRAVFVLIMGHIADLYTFNVAYQAAAVLLFIIPVVYSFLNA